MAKPTASDSGTNSDRTGSAIRKAGMNTDRMHTSARPRHRGDVVAVQHSPAQRRHLSSSFADFDGGGKPLPRPFSERF